MIRVGTAYDTDDFSLGKPIHFADEVIAPFSFYCQTINLRQIAQYDLTGAPRGLHGRIQHRMHDLPQIVKVRKSCAFYLLPPSFSAGMRLLWQKTAFKCDTTTLAERILTVAASMDGKCSL